MEQYYHYESDMSRLNALLLVLATLFLGSVGVLLYLWSQLG